MLTPDDRRHLLALARGALEARVRRVPCPAVAGVPVRWRTGAFVTILCDGELRGCLGRIEPALPLPDLIGQLSTAVADSDPRFVAVQPHELSRIHIEISVLAPEQEIESVAEIEIGRHGLIVERGASRGLLLPQVPVEHGWDVETFVAHACRKAGLAADAWRRGARMYVFEAQVFREG
jgi:AmmeMemoRadiSam system protein A